MKHIILLTNEIQEQMDKACCTTDIFDTWGILEKVKDKSITRYNQVEMNTKMYDKIATIFCKNVVVKNRLKYCSDKEVRLFLQRRNPKDRQSIVLFDWMNYSPKSNDNVPINEIWWYDKEMSK